MTQEDRSSLATILTAIVNALGSLYVYQENDDDGGRLVSRKEIDALRKLLIRFEAGEVT